MKHRGPDWSGLHQHGDNYLAHQRLAIVDPASGDQPLFNEDKSIIVTVIIFYSLLHFLYYIVFKVVVTYKFYHKIQVNGEIYNHEDLRKQLPNHKFRTQCDCDVIAHLVSMSRSRLRSWTFI